MNNISFEKIWSFIIKNKNKLELLGIITGKEDIFIGDDFYGEDGETFFLKIRNMQFRVGYVFLQEQEENDYKQDRPMIEICTNNEHEHVDYKIVYELLTNLEFLREVQLNKIGI